MSAMQRPPAFWILVIPFLLLTGWLAACQLATDAFSSDEMASLRVAGGAYFGPFTPIEAWDRVAELSPDQAVGLAVTLSVWGQIVGWAEFPVRALPFFAGLLALAWVFRAGRDLFSPAVGLLAVALLGLSVFFVTYMRIARVFTIVALLISLVSWSYWRVALHPRQPGVASQIGLAAGSIGLLYAHYFAALLLAALGLYHLLLAPRNTRWWRALLLLALAAVAFLPEFRVFIQGYEHNLGNTALHDEALTPLESVSQLVYYFSNGSLALRDTGSLMLFAAAIAVGVAYGIRARRSISRNLGLVLFVTSILLILILAANAWLQIMTLKRIRYMMPLWPLLAVLTGVAFMQAARIHPRVPLLVLGGWVVLGLWSNLATDLRGQIDLFTPHPPLHRARQEILRSGAASDLLMIDGFWRGNGRTREFYLGHGISMKRAFIYPWSTMNDFRSAVDDRLRVWIVTEDRTSSQSVDLQAMLKHDFVHCSIRVDAPSLVLDLYARSETFCPGDQRELRFGDAITLAASESSLTNNRTLQVDMAWRVESQVPPDTYSIGLYVFDAQTHTFVAQADDSLPAPPFVPLRSQVDLSDLTPGDYDLNVSVYDWKTGARLMGLDERSEARGDMLRIDTFEIQPPGP